MDSSTFWENIENAENSPDIKFTVFDSKKFLPVGVWSLVNDVPRLKSTGTVQSLLEMHVLMSKSLSIVSPQLMFTSDFPDYLLSSDDPRYIGDIPTISAADNAKMPHHRNDLWERNYSSYNELEQVPVPHITWSVVKQEPGTMSDGRPFTGKSEFKPRLRECVAVFNSDTAKHLGSYNLRVSQVFKDSMEQFVEIYGQQFDCLVQYNIWARSSWEAEELVEWFIEYMTKYTGLYREAGIVQMFFWNRVRDDSLSQIKNGYHVRSVLYYIRTEKINLHTIKPIEKVTMNINSETGAGIINSSTNTKVIDENFIDTLLDKWSNK